MYAGSADYVATDILNLNLTLDNEAARCFRVYRTILEIMEYRQYFVNDQSKKIEYAEFKDKFEQQELVDKKQIFAPLNIDEDDECDRSIAVFYNFNKEEISAEYLNRIVKSCDNLYHFFIVVPNQTKKNAVGIIDRKAASFISDLSKKGKGDQPYRFELFKQEDLLFNVLKHDLVPEHRVLPDSEKGALLAKYKVKQSQLPKILLHDPVSKFLGLKRGQIVKITRKSETAGTYTSYRIAV